MTQALLKLKAESGDDLAIISAMVQDAALKISDLTFLPKSRRFAAVMNRFKWEDGKQDRKGLRVRSGLRIESVLSAKRKSLPLEAKDQVLSMLSIVTENVEGGTKVTLFFSGGAMVELIAECVDIYLEDLSGPWKALDRPNHSTDGEEGAS